MNSQNPEQEILARIPKRLPRPLLALFGLLVILGLAAFIRGVTGGDSQRAWQVFLVNFLFWSGIAQSGIVFSALLHVSNGHWGRPVRRIAESTAGFLPLSLVLFVVLFFGRTTIFPWVHHPVPQKAAWLSTRFLFVRDGIALLVLYGLSLLSLYYSLRPDLGFAVERGAEKPGRLYLWMTSNWRGLEAERRHSQRVLSVVSTVILITYAYVFSLLAFDLVMSLSPRWSSTLFGGYFFMGNLYLGLAAVISLTVLTRKYLGLEAYVASPQFHDLGKLLFSFCIFWAYLSFTQYLVTWYGNVPEETEFLIRRTREAPWSALSRSYIIIGFAIPFMILLSREVKRRAGSLLVISALVIVGMWLERYVLVVPSLWDPHEIPFGLIEVLITLAFFGAFAMTYLAFMRVFPAISLADLTSYEGAHGHVGPAA